MSFTSNPIRRAMGTSFVFARSLKSACDEISSALMTCRLPPSISAHELWFRDIPPNDGRRGHEASRFNNERTPGHPPIVVCNCVGDYCKAWVFRFVLEPPGTEPSAPQTVSPAHLKAHFVPAEWRQFYAPGGLCHPSDYFGSKFF